MPGRPYAERIQDIRTFDEDLRAFADLIDAYQTAIRDFEMGSRPDRPVLGPQHDVLRFSLIQRSGAIRPICEGLTGVITKPDPKEPAFRGAKLNIWDVVLYHIYFDNKGADVRDLVDRLLSVIGRLEADPALLDSTSPKQPRQTDPSSGQRVTNKIRNYGNVNIANTVSGNVNQSQVVEERDHLNQLLGALKEAIEQLDAPAEDREAYIEPVAALQQEIQKAHPLRTRLTILWAGICGFATLTEAWRGWEQVQQLVNEVSPKLERVIQVLST